MPILRLAIPTPLRSLFDYLPPAELGPEAIAALQPGCRLRVNFGRRQLQGYLVEVATDSELPASALKEAREVLDTEALPSASLLQLCLWAADYYQHPPGEVLELAFPPGLRDGKPHQPPGAAAWTLSQRGKGLPTGALGRSPRQAEALQLLQQGGAIAATVFKELGISTSILRQLEQKGLAERCILPPATQTPQPGPGLALNPDQAAAVSGILAGYGSFGQGVVVLHSGLNAGERYAAWEAARTGAAGIVIGTRSAIFTSLQRPGLIIVDEEHDSSFKQQDGFRYSARDLAVKRAQIEDCTVVLGSATPALETLHNALQGRYGHHQLTLRAGSGELPAIAAIDVRRQELQGGMSGALRDAVRSSLEAGHQVLLFLNRRGYAPTLQCHDCGWIAQCRACAAITAARVRACPSGAPNATATAC